MRNFYFIYTPLLFGAMGLAATAVFYLIHLKTYYQHGTFWLILGVINFIVGLAFGRYIALLHRNGAVDVLTGLYNRRYLYANLEKAISMAKRKEGSFSLAILDIDNFKEINDEQGHLVGDKVLKKVSYIIKKNIRATDFACRWGGEEFILILHNASIEGAESVLDRIRKEVNALAGITLSAGVVRCSDVNGIEAENLLKQADKALYEAKVNKNSVISYELVC